MGGWGFRLKGSEGTIGDRSTEYFFFFLLFLFLDMFHLPVALIEIREGKKQGVVGPFLRSLSQLWTGGRLCRQILSLLLHIDLLSYQQILFVFVLFIGDFDSVPSGGSIETTQFFWD